MKRLACVQKRFEAGLRQVLPKECWLEEDSTRGRLFQIGDFVFNARTLKYMAYDSEPHAFLHAQETLSASGEVQVTFPWLKKVAEHAQGATHRLTARVLVKGLKCLVPHAIVNFNGLWAPNSSPIGCVLKAKQFDNDEEPCKGLNVFLTKARDKGAAFVGAAMANCDKEEVGKRHVVEALSKGVSMVLVRTAPSCSTINRSQAQK